MSAIQINATVNNTKCYFQANGSITLTINGGKAPYNIQWNNAANTSQINNLAAGNYTVVITDSFTCQLSESYTIVEPPALDMTTSFTDDYTNNCIGTATCSPSGGILPYSYTWNDPNNQTTATAIDLCAGMYKVTLSDSNNCLSYRTLFIHNTLGLDNNNDDNSITIYPNPTKNGIFNIEFKNTNGDKMSIKLYNTIGELIEERDINVSNGSNEIFNISEYSAGVYYLRILSNSDIEKVFKLIVE